MQDEFVNRLGMFRTALGTLNDPANQPVWSGQPPVIFTTKVGQAATAVTELEAFVAQQQVVITGAAAVEKGVGFNLCAAPSGPFRQIEPDPFFARGR